MNPKRFVFLISILTAVDVEDKSIVTGSDQMITCDMSGLSAAADVTWINPAGNVISETDTSNYVINQGRTTFNAGVQEATLTIKKPILATWSSDQIYKCAVQSTSIPTTSPQVLKQFTLTPLVLG